LRERLVSGVDAKEGAAESACKARGDDSAEDVGELAGETALLKVPPLLDLESRELWVYEDFVMNFGCECDRRRGLDEK